MEATLAMMKARDGAVRDQPLLAGQTSFRLSNDQTLGPAKTKWTATSASTRATQGMITQNVVVRKDLFATRKRATETLSEQQRLGAATSVEDTDIHPHELIFTYKRPTVRRAAGTGAVGFTSFNALPTAQFNGDQHAFESNFRLLGRAKIAFDFESDEQSNSGVSAQVRGACSTVNRGVTEFFPHDRVKYRLPALDATQREQELAALHEIEGHPKRKLLPMLELVTYGDVWQLPQRALETYLRDAASDANSVQRRQIGDRPTAAVSNDLTRFAIGFARQGALSKLLSGVAVLLELGVLQFNPAFAAAANGGRIVDSEQAFNAALAVANKRVKEAAGAQGQQLEALAYMLDLAPESMLRPWLRPAEQLIEQLVLTQQRGLLSDKRRADEEKSTSIEKYVPGSRVAKDLERLQVDAARHELELFALAKQSEDEKTVGVALSHARPGEYLDILL